MKINNTLMFIFNNETYNKMYDPALGRFLNPDPEVQLPDNTQSYNRYTYCVNNPLRYVDLNGKNTYVFDRYGRLERIHYNTHTNNIMVHLVEYENGQTWDSYHIYELADPINDGNDIEKGIITHLEFVSDSQIHDILNKQGAWTSSKSDFVKESTSNKRFDYSYSILRYLFEEAVFNGTSSSYLFLPEGDNMAHNFMNFGNYLWGATGYVVGFDVVTLQLGAHLNSLFLGKHDGWSNSWDSTDDQESIIKGYFHAKRHNY